MDIRTVAHETPRDPTFHVDPAAGYQTYVSRSINYSSVTTGPQVKQCVKLVGDLYRAFVEKGRSDARDQPLMIVSDMAASRSLDAR